MPSRVEQAETDLIAYILSHHLAAGDRLPNETQLSQLLGVGRSTVREAIKQLASRNVLTVRQGAGTFVSAKKGVPEDPLGLLFLPDDIGKAMDLLEIRLMLEPEIAAMAAVHAGAQDLKEIAAQCSAVQKQIDAGEDYTQGDMLFHRLIARACGNRVVANLLPVIHSSIALCIDITGWIYREDTRREHRRITDALLRRDAAGARYGMITHLNTNRMGMQALRMHEKP